MALTVRKCLGCAHSKAWNLVGDILAVRDGLKPALLVDHTEPNLERVAACVRMLALDRELDVVPMSRGQDASDPFTTDLFVVNKKALQEYLLDLVEGRRHIAVVDVSMDPRKSQWAPRVFDATEATTCIQHFRDIIIGPTRLGHVSAVPPQDAVLVPGPNPFYIGVMLGFPVVYWVGGPEAQHGLNGQDLSLYRFYSTNDANHPTSSFSVPAAVELHPLVVQSINEWRTHTIDALDRIRSGQGSIEGPSAVCQDPVAL